MFLYPFCDFMKQCPRCNNPLDNQINYCSGCGFQFSPYPYQNLQPIPSFKTSKKTIIISIIIVAIVLISSLICIIKIYNDTDKDGNSQGIDTFLVSVISANRTSVQVNEIITFDAGQSQGNITSYLWDFGDGKKGDNVSVIHSYSDGGRYLVNLTVRNKEGVTATSTISIGVTLIAVISANKTSVQVNENITFNAGQSQFNISSYLWDFGDGKKGDNVSVIHSYSDGGRYLVNLTVRNKEGVTATSTISIGVTLIAVISANKTSVQVNENITFNAGQSQFNISSYLWDFGDGKKGDNVSVIHSYRDGGKYRVELTVLSDRGATNSTEIYIGVTYHQDENGTLYAYPILPDSVIAAVPIKNGSRNMNINLTIDPISIRSVDMDITIYDLNNTAIYNATHEGVTQQETFLHSISKFQICGDYKIELVCNQGSADYDLGIDVNYKDT